jgi:putative endonuclease
MQNAQQTAPQYAQRRAAIPYRRRERGRAAQARGVVAERAARAALERDGWHILGERVRTPAGEIDIVAERAGLVSFVEVKARPTLYEAAFALTERQQRRLLAAGEILLAENPYWGCNGARHDLLLVDAALRVRRIRDAFRPE